MNYSDPYELLKLGTKKLRKELNALMKPRGFNISVRIGKQNYWRKGTVNVKIKTPSWFEYRDKSGWYKSEKAIKLSDSIKNRLINIIYQLHKDIIIDYTWGYNQNLESNQIRNGIEWNFNFE